MAKRKSIEDLLADKARIENEIAVLERQQAIESLANGPEFRKLSKAIGKLAMSDEEIVGLFRQSTKNQTSRTKPATRSKKKSATIAFGTYQHPEDPSTTWSGRGRKPA